MSTEHRRLYLDEALASDDPYTVFREGLFAVKDIVAPTLDAFSLKDLPLVIAGLRLLANALETHPAMGPCGRELSQAILDGFSVCTVDTSALQDMIGRQKGER